MNENNIPNNLTENQRKRFVKLYCENFYLIKNMLSCKKDDFACFKISGSTQKIYDVIYLKNGSIKCNCPDMKTHCVKYKCVCKHICFVLVKILKFKDHYFYDQCKLKYSDNELLKNKIKNLSTIIDSELTNKELLKKYEIATTKVKLPEVKCLESEDKDCMICFDNMDSSKSKLDICQVCSNMTHSDCMKKWLSTSSDQNCIFCRSKWYSGDSKNGTFYGTEYVQL